MRVVLIIFHIMQEHSSHSQEQEGVEEENSPEPPSSSPKDTSGRTDEVHSTEVSPPQVRFYPHASFVNSLRTNHTIARPSMLHPC